MRIQKSKSPATRLRLIAAAGCSILGLFATVELVAQSSSPPMMPVVVAAIDDNRSAVISANGDLDIITLPAGGRVRVWNVDAPRISDIAAVSINGNISVVVSVSSQANSGSVLSSLRFWPDRPAIVANGVRLSGIALVPGQPNAAYVATGGGREVHSVDLQNRQSRKFFAAVGDPSTGLGALAIDPSGTTLYAVDAYGGQVFRIDVATAKVTLFAKDLSAPTAIAVTRETVVVADEDIGRLILFPRDRPEVQSARRADSLKTPEFKAPVGVSIRDSNSVWVADLRAKAVFLVSLTERRTLRVFR